MGTLRKRNCDAAFVDDNDGVRETAARDTQNNDHYRERQPEQERKRLNENVQQYKNKTVCGCIVLGLCVNTLLYTLFLVQHPGTPVWFWDAADGLAVVTLNTNFTPLDPSVFSSFIDSEKSRHSLYGVLSWKVAAVSWSWVQPKAFTALLPEEGISAQPGHVWTLLPDTTKDNFMFRYGPRGAVAVVRARSTDCLDVCFRLHAEYQLNTPPRRPLWFTPAAFIGRVVINTTDADVKYFSMFVPTHNFLNVDLEWLTGPNEDVDMEVTITHLPQMTITTDTMNPNELNWKEQIQQDEALKLVGKTFYKYMQVEYHNFTEAYSVASSERQPIHSVVLWGVLADQSC
ncbi:selenoprotein N-like isoform X2 [Homarus americanus]|uniref:selenoprotein N-like isoform X2 n=1 Tax=Homarus americanus TaxID=6706 RepID=UPI001C441E0D|nr:selenoprotein N-like isoform X2 [Homarus americanus]